MARFDMLPGEKLIPPTDPLIQYTGRIDMDDPSAYGFEWVGAGLRIRISGGTLKEGDPLRDVLIDHGSPNGRCSWDPMLVQLALTGDIERAGYRAVRGTASVDEVGGGNHFVPSEDGQHCYVVKVKDNDYYKDTINAIIA